MSPTTWSQPLLPSIILVFCLIEYSLNETELPGPQNLAAERGTKVQLNCLSHAKDQITWMLTNPIKEEELLYWKSVTERVKDRFSVDNSSERNVNLLFKASESNSGRFSCRRSADNEPDTAQVIALDPRPECSKEYEPGFVKAKCSIGFSGYWPPKLEWLNANVTLEPNVPKTTPYSHVNSSVTVLFNEAESRAPYNLTCTPKFTLENIPQDTTAKNIPEYPNSCTVTIGPKPTEPTKAPPKPIPKDLSKGDNDTKPDTGASVSVHNWHSLYLCQCFAASILIGMLHKWLGQ